jgi:hypothetical protein
LIVQQIEVIINGTAYLETTLDDGTVLREIKDKGLGDKPTVITKLAFRRRFTFSERLAFDNFEENPVLTVEQKQTLRTLAKDYEMAGEIDLLDPDTLSGLQFMESCGLIDAGRASQILGL